MEDIITKRLHISGLTPALTADDISKRLSFFGTVKAVDGFGLSDAVGRPRKFGYVTLETTQPKLHKCFNTLSGSTWKGAKLRIGEARPDFAERLASERELDTSDTVKKLKRKYTGVHASDMSLVTPENVATRSGWKVTPLGRMLRPMRMRPARPLPPPREHKVQPTRGTKPGGQVKKSKKVKTPDERARRRKIDMTRYGSTYLKGMFLEMDVLGTRRQEVVEEARDVQMEDIGSESESASQDATQGEDNMAVGQLASQAKITQTGEKTTSVKAAVDPAIETMDDTRQDLDIATEKVQSLSLLASIFGNDNDKDWIGRESVDSDVDEAQLTKEHRLRDYVDSEDFEIVPMDAEATSDRPQTPLEVEEEAAPPLPTMKQQQAKDLKDLFAPREDTATFSLLGHLELDLELDDEIPFAISEGVSTQEPTQITSNVASTSAALPSNYSIPQLNPKLPLFFPLDSASSSQQSLKARPRDIFDVARENGWHWRDRSAGFFRTGTEEEIREQWENSKVELTREWKRRWKEAGKISRRRRHGADGELDG